MDKKAIVIVDFNGSSPTYTHYFSMPFSKQGHKVQILGHRNAEDLKIYKETLPYIGFKTPSKLLNYFLNWSLLLLKAKSFDVIHIQWLQFLKFSSFELWCLRLLKARNKQVFYTVHNIYPHNESRKKIKRRYDRLYALLNNLVVHTEATATRFTTKYPDKKIIKIDHGLFYSGFGALDIPEEPQMAMLGMISPYKGYEDVLLAMKEMKKGAKQFSLHIEGSGNPEYIAQLREKIKALDLDEVVTIKEGYIKVDRLIALYKKSFVTLMPYKKIEQSGVLFTSFGLNVPVVGYNVGGVQDVLRDKIYGRLVEKGNIEAFIEAVYWTYEHKKTLHEKLKKNEYRYLWDNTATTLLKHYFS
ncbi:glycosyltransferase family 4 protein [Spongiimicrobium salis]|uniref:glycosyltransferase family 4 protein n=1 Tax=Spongiimicrobium salis TaxID=1667022 RepID=UPI00374CF90E